VEKEARMIVRCSRETRRRFREFTAKWGFRDYEEALNFLLDRAESLRWAPAREWPGAF
jgi:hypothetical protein